MRSATMATVLVLSSGCLPYRLARMHEDLPLRDTDTTSGTSGSSESSGEADISAAEDGGMEGSGSTIEGSTSTGPVGATGSSGGETSGGDPSSTGEPAPVPVCGNGVLEAYGAVPEECDDANTVDDDGCNAACAADRTVFVTSSLYSAGLDGIYFADAQCANAADDAGFVDPLRYRAWMSDSQTDARDHIVAGRGRWVLPNGLVVADSFAALLAGELQRPINVTEMSQSSPNYDVWTGTLPDGTKIPWTTFCDDWTSSSLLIKTYVGSVENEKPGWWTYIDDYLVGCVGGAVLYCFESLE